MLHQLENCDTLFLDRDGTINVRLVDAYVKTPKEFKFLPGALEAIKQFSKFFKYIIIVTNQQGIGKDLMSHDDLRKVHELMLMQVEHFGGRIDEIFYCPHLKALDPSCRKPNPGMAFQAVEKYPDIEFSKSIMVGDMPSDIEFGRRLGMKTVLIHEELENEDYFGADLRVSSLSDLATYLINI